MHLKVSHWKTVSSLRKISDKTVGFKCTLKETFINLKLKNFTKILLKLFKVSFIMASFFHKTTFFSVENITRDIPIETMKTPNTPTLIKLQNLNEEDQRSEYIAYWQTGPLTIREYAV